MSTVVFQAVVNLQASCRSLANSMSTLDVSHRDHAMRLVSMHSRIEALESQVGNILKLVGERSLSSASAVPLSASVNPDELQAIRVAAANAEAAAQKALASANLSQQAAIDARNSQDAVAAASVIATNASVAAESAVSKVLTHLASIPAPAPVPSPEFTFTVPPEPDTDAVIIPTEIDPTVVEDPANVPVLTKPAARKRPTTTAARKSKA